MGKVRWKVRGVHYLCWEPMASDLTKALDLSFCAYKPSFRIGTILVKDSSSTAQGLEALLPSVPTCLRAVFSGYTFMVGCYI